jgi:hypothetical protein
MNCLTCGRELVFVYDGKWHVFHAGTVNVADRDIFTAGARVGTPSVSTQYRLRRQIAPWRYHSPEWATAQRVVRTRYRNRIECAAIRRAMDVRNRALNSGYTDLMHLRTIGECAFQYARTELVTGLVQAVYTWLLQEPGGTKQLKTALRALEFGKPSVEAGGCPDEETEEWNESDGALIAQDNENLRRRPSRARSALTKPTRR